MSEQEREVQRWTAGRKRAVVLEVLKGQTTGVDACRKYGIKQSELEEWTERFLEAGEKDAHLVVLKDGRLLCTFARHTVPNGIFAVTSDDQGETWDTDNPIYLAGSNPTYAGRLSELVEALGFDSAYAKEVAAFGSPS